MQMKTNMKRNLLTLAAIGAIAIAGYAFAEPPQDGFGGRHGHWIDQARPQIIAIHKDAMEKTHAIMDKTMSQIRPILTPDQQKKFDALQKARQDMRNAMQELHRAMAE